MLRFAPPALAIVSWVAGGCFLDSAGSLAGAPGEGGAGGGSTTMTSSSTAGGSDAGGGAVTSTGGGAAGGGAGPLCEDGVVDAGEACDDGNQVAFDGCTDCVVDPGHDCSGEPSVCALIPPAVVDTGGGLSFSIADDERYDGTIASMDCVALDVPDRGYPSTQSAEVEVAIDHDYLGDLIFKLVSPAGTVVTLMSRPGLDEPVDTSDESDGDDSNLRVSAPVRFASDGGTDAELMGDGINNNDVACADDGKCSYLPNPGAGSGVLADLVGEDPAGTWQLCAADGDDNDVGVIDRVVLTVLSW